MVKKLEVLERLQKKLKLAQQAKKRSGGDATRLNREEVRSAIREELKLLTTPERMPERDRKVRPGKEWASKFAKQHLTRSVDIHTGGASQKLVGTANPVKAIAQAQAHAYKGFLGGLRIEVDTSHGDRRPRVRDQKLADLQALHDEVYVAKMLLASFGNPECKENPNRAVKRTQIWRDWVDATKDIKAVLDPVTAGEGLEWMPVELSQSFLDAVFIGWPLLSVIPTIAMPTNPFKIPGTTSTPTAYSPALGVAPSARAGVNSVQRSIEAQMLKSYEEWMEELDEDAIVSIAPIVTQQLIDSIGRGAETMLINGDSAGTHQDFDVEGGASDLPQKAVEDGLRKSALANSATLDFTQKATFTKEDLVALRAKLTKGWKERPAELFWLTGTEGYEQNFLDIEEIWTRDKFGTPLLETGSINSVLGSQIYISSEFPENLHDTGVNTTGQANDTTGIIVGNRRGGFTGYRRQTRIERDRNILTGVEQMVASARIGFQLRVDPSVQSVFAYGFNARTAVTA